MTDDLRREALQAYYASISFMDAQVGRVLVATELQFGGAFLFGIANVTAADANDGGLLGGRNRKPAGDGVGQRSFPVRRHAGRHERIDGLTGGRGQCDGNDRIVAENEERRTIGRARLLFAPVPDFPKDSQPQAAQAAARLDAPHLVGIRGGEVDGVGDQPRARFLVPSEPAFGGQVGTEQVRHGFQVAGIVAGIFLHPGRQGTLRPVRLLGTFLQRDSQIIANQRGQREFPAANEARGEHGIENSRGHEAWPAMEQAKIVIGGVKNQFASQQSLPQRGEIQSSERIDELMGAVEADLHEAELFRIRVETVRLGINSQPFSLPQDRSQGGQAFCRRNHGHSLRRNRPR